MFLPWYFILIACFQVVIFPLHFHLPNLSRKIKKVEKKQLYKKKKWFSWLSDHCAFQHIELYPSLGNCFLPQILPPAFNNGIKHIYVLYSRSIQQKRPCLVRPFSKERELRKQKKGQKMSDRHKGNWRKLSLSPSFTPYISKYMQLLS